MLCFLRGRRALRKPHKTRRSGALLKVSTVWIKEVLNLPA
jgi:hypothetical protein